jgi:serine/threonine-protein kinase
MSLLSSEETQRRAEEQVGRTVGGKYRLDSLLGVGGMAAVYAATHRNGNRVAIKLLYPELTRSGDILMRFVREGYAANRVGHPGAVRVLDDVRDEDGSAFLVMELLEGDSVDALQASGEGRIAAADLMPWMNELLDVLAAAHEQGIIHRDIKPENLFITREGRLKVLDFGIARIKSEPSASVTRTGNQFGTPPFMSPEQALGRMKDIDARSDLYSVGATMFYLLTGHDVHPAESPNEMLVLAATKPARALATVAPSLPACLAHIVDTALAFERQERWQSAREMQEALRQAHVEIFGEPLPALPSPDSAKRGLADRGSAASLRVKAPASGRNPVSSNAETQAAESSGPHILLRSRPELAATAPPTSALAQRGSGSRRRRVVLAIAGVLVCSAAGVAAFTLRSSGTSAPVAAPVTVSPAPAAPPAPSASASSPAPLAPAATAASSAAAPSSSAIETTASAEAPKLPLPAAAPPARRRPRPGPGASPTRSSPSETGAFEHQ